MNKNLAHGWRFCTLLTRIVHSGRQAGTHCDKQVMLLSAFACLRCSERFRWGGESRLCACVCVCAFQRARTICAHAPANLCFSRVSAHAIQIYVERRSLFIFIVSNEGVRPVESITIPSIHSCSSNVDIIYMVMWARWPPRVTQWTSLTVDSSGVQWHPNGMQRHGHTHTHKHKRARSRPTARRHVSISRCRSPQRCVCVPGWKGRVYCFASSTPLLFTPSFLLSAELKNSSHLWKRGGGWGLGGGRSLSRYLSLSQVSFLDSWCHSSGANLTWGCHCACHFLVHLLFNLDREEAVQFISSFSY